MINKNEFLKIIFGLIIFLFSLALAYFTASYAEKLELDYWGTLLVFTGIYLILGIMISKIYSISLGFLFSTDILILHIMVKNFDKWDDIIKTLVVGGILIILYIIAWFVLTDEKESEIISPQNINTQNQA